MDMGEILPFNREGFHFKPDDDFGESIVDAMNEVHMLIVSERLKCHGQVATIDEVKNIILLELPDKSENDVIFESAELKLDGETMAVVADIHFLKVGDIVWDGYDHYAKVELCKHGEKHYVALPPDIAAPTGIHVNDFYKLDSWVYGCCELRYLPTLLVRTLEDITKGKMLGGKEMPAGTIIEVVAEGILRVGDGKYCLLPYDGPYDMSDLRDENGARKMKGRFVGFTDTQDKTHFFPVIGCQIMDSRSDFVTWHPEGLIKP